MTMTRKHFDALALALENSKPLPGANQRLAQWKIDVRAITEVLLAHNPRFDTRFYAACGYETQEANSGS